MLDKEECLLKYNNLKGLDNYPILCGDEDDDCDECEEVSFKELFKEELECFKQLIDEYFEQQEEYFEQQEELDDYKEEVIFLDKVINKMAEDLSKVSIFDEEEIINRYCYFAGGIEDD